MIESFVLRIVIAAILAAASFAESPLLAQDTFPVDCMVTEGGPELASLIVDDKLSSNGLGRAFTEAEKHAADEVYLDCVVAHAVPENQQCDYFVANYAYVISQELRNRMTAAGLDMGPVNSLIPLVIDTPEMEFGRIVLDDPALFGKPIEDVADEHNLELSLMVWWILEYVAASYSARIAKEAISRPETVC